MQRIEDNPPNPIRPIPGANYQAHPTFFLRLLPMPVRCPYYSRHLHITLSTCYMHALCICLFMYPTSHTPRTHLPVHLQHLLISSYSGPPLPARPPIPSLATDGRCLREYRQGCRYIDKCEYGGMNRIRIASITQLRSALEII